jgi:type I restriction enzyme M protein
MAVKKSELYSSLWASCDELRGAMDASQYKDYVLFLLFVKYVSDRYAGEPYAAITIPEGAAFSDMVALKGKSDIGDQINKTIIAPLKDANKLSDLPDFNDATKLGTGKEMVDRLTNLIGIFENPALDFSKNRADGDDILGDAYEYLMRHFATQSGKSKGQFYTPAEVSRVVAKVLGIHEASTSPSTTVYDPTCGSGSLLLKVADEATTEVTLYGQEKDAKTAGLARMNMILHENPTAMIMQGNTLANPLFQEKTGALKTFDYVVANPPFSDKRWSTGLLPEQDPYERFKHFGVPPGKQGDYAYLLHIVRSLKSQGRGACILPHGVLFRGNAEAGIRKKLIRKGYIQGIIGLPPNLFYGTGIPACVIVIDKAGAAARKGVYMVDASKGFKKDGNKNRLREMDIHRVVDVWTKQTEAPKYARMVGFEEIEKNDFNLNLPRYIDSQAEEDVQDIEGHLRGGIPVADVDALGAYWAVCPGLRSSLFSELRPGYVTLSGEMAGLKQRIYGHSAFAAFIGQMEALFGQWRAQTTPALKGLETGCKPKVRIAELGESLLQHYADQPLIDRYDVYQRLMDYWVEVMQDDVYLIAADGWKAEAVASFRMRKRKGQEVRVEDGWACDLVPKPLIVGRYFSDEQAAIAALQARLESASSQFAKLEDEYGGEEGALLGISGKTDAQVARQESIVEIWAANWQETFTSYERSLACLQEDTDTLLTMAINPFVEGCANSKGTITQASINRRLKLAADSEEQDVLREYKQVSAKIAATKKNLKELLSVAVTDIAAQSATDTDNDDFSDLRIIEQYLSLIDTISIYKKDIKDAEANLDAQARAKYTELSEVEVQALVVDDKWMMSLGAAIHGEVERISQALTRRVQALGERYEMPLPVVTTQVEALEAKVAGHLTRMGFSW